MFRVRRQGESIETSDSVETSTIDSSALSRSAMAICACRHCIASSR